MKRKAKSLFYRSQGAAKAGAGEEKTEAQKMIEAKQKKHDEEEEERIRELEEQRRVEREKEEEELRRLKEKQVRRYSLRGFTVFYSPPIHIASFVIRGKHG